MSAPAPNRVDIVPFKPKGALMTLKCVYRLRGVYTYIA